MADLTPVKNAQDLLKNGPSAENMPRATSDQVNALKKGLSIYGNGANASYGNVPVPAADTRTDYEKARDESIALENKSKQPVNYAPTTNDLIKSLIKPPIPSQDIANPVTVDPFGGKVETVHTQATAPMMGKTVSQPVSNAGMGMQALNPTVTPLPEIQTQKPKVTETLNKILNPAPVPQKNKKIYVQEKPTEYGEINDIGPKNNGRPDLSWLAAILGTAGDVATASGGGKPEAMKNIADRWQRAQEMQSQIEQQGAAQEQENDRLNKELANRLQIAGMTHENKVKPQPMTRTDKIRASLF